MAGAPYPRIFKSVAACVFVLLTIAAMHPFDDCGDGPLCEFERAENTALLPGSDWELISQHGNQSLLLVDLDSGDRFAVTADHTSNATFSVPVSDDSARY